MRDLYSVHYIAGHVGEDGRFKQNQSGYITCEGLMPKIYDTVIVFQNIPEPSLSLDLTKPQPLLASAQVIYSSKFVRTSL